MTTHLYSPATGASVLAREILTKYQVAELLGVTPRYIERQVTAGRLKACKPTYKTVRFYRRDIDAFLASGASLA